MSVGLWCLLAAPATAAEPVAVWLPDSAQPQVLDVQPLAAPVSATVRPVPRFALRQTISSAASDPVTATGSGRLQIAGASRTLVWQIDRIAIGQKPVQGRGKPLALVSMRLDARGAMQSAVITYPAYFEAGAANLDPSGYDYLFVAMLTGSLSSGWAALSGGPIGMGQPAFDANGYISGLFNSLAPGTMLTQRLPMGTVVGVVNFNGKQALVARVAGQAALRLPKPQATATVNVDAFSLLDVDTSLPIYTDAAVTIATPGTGSVDAILRTYVQY